MSSRGGAVREIERADSIHYQVGAKLAFEDRIRHLEDPDFGDPKIPMLISKEHAAKRRELLADVMHRPELLRPRWEGTPPTSVPLIVTAMRFR